MDTRKSDVCECLDLNQSRLHEIELEDIKLEPLIQQNIYKTIAKMFTPEGDCGAELCMDPPLLPLGEITCKGYWVENTKELVLYICLGEQTKAIIVPKNGWNLRKDITIH